MHHVPGLHKRFPVLVHEARPALEHDDNLKICFMPVPASARFWCHIGLDQVRNHLAVRGLGNAEVAVQKEIAQAAGDKLRIARLDV